MKMRVICATLAGSFLITAGPVQVANAQAQDASPSKQQPRNGEAVPDEAERPQQRPDVGRFNAANQAEAEAYERLASEFSRAIPAIGLNGALYVLGRVAGTHSPSSLGSLEAGVLSGRMTARATGQTSK